MEKFNDTPEFSWGYTKRKLAQAIIALAESFDDAHDVWSTEDEPLWEHEVEPE